MHLLFVSCEKEYYISSSDIESKLVVNGLFENDKPWDIGISKSYSILDNINDDHIIRDAVVKIYDENHSFLYELKQTIDGRYTHEVHTPEIDKHYILTVEKEGFNKVEAKGYCPERSNIKLGETQEIYENGNTVVQLDFEIVQSKATDNYYIWDVKENRKNSELIHGMIISDIISSSDVFYGETVNVSYDASITHNKSFSIGSQVYKIDNQTHDPNGYIAYNNDAEAGINTFNANQGTIIIETGVPSYGNGSSSGTTKDNTQRPNKFKFHLITISRELYLHTISLSDNTKTGSTSSSDSHHAIYSNVEGGLGVFAGLAQQSITFK